jgi:fatty-acyl-CoA synthase
MTLMEQSDAGHRTGLSADKAASARLAREAWMRALTLTGSIARNPERTFPVAVEQVAATAPDTPALIDGSEYLTYRALMIRIQRYRNWATAQGIAKGDVVSLMIPNCVDYVALWLAITGLGAVAALINTNLSSEALAHVLRVASSNHAVIDASLGDAYLSAAPSIGGATKFWAYGGRIKGLQRLDWKDWAPEANPSELPPSERPTLRDRALLIYTSGTTGLPKAAVVSHYRVMQWSHWFAGMMDVSPSDRMYDCLPMYHSVGGVVAIGAMLVSGASVMLRPRFSAGQFWDDIAVWNCTLVQYIGELCRYLLNSASHPRERAHRVRLFCGNGLRGEIWRPFKQRFSIPRILEFYAATEGTFSLYNCEGEPGAIGKIPSFVKQRSAVSIVRVDHDGERPLRGPDGFCIRCETDEVGEAIGRIDGPDPMASNRFEGYVDQDASERKILRDVFAEGDAWFRTGDLMRKDDRGFFYFADRIGDSFRWKGENVSSDEVERAIACCPGVLQAVVYGVTVPGMEGKAGMAAILVREDFDLAALRRRLIAELPDYARPVFVRLCREIQSTGTFKPRKAELVQVGFDQAATTDPIFFDDRTAGAFVRADVALRARIAAGALRL